MSAPAKGFAPRFAALAATLRPPSDRASVGLRPTIAFFLLIGTTLASACSDPNGSMAASLKVSASTSGADPDRDGYTILVDDDAGRPLGPNGTLTLLDLEPGEHRVELGSNANNCGVTGENPRQVSLAPGATVSVTFYVTCAAATGALVVRAATTGDGQDPDGYVLAVDGGSTRRLADNDSLTFTALAPGDHRIDVLDVVTNCSLNGEASRTVTVGVGETVHLALAIACTPRSLHITTATTGRAPDPDGYTVSVDGGPAQPIAVAGSLESVGSSTASTRCCWVAWRRSVTRSRTPGRFRSPVRSRRSRSRSTAPVRRRAASCSAG